MLTQGIHAYVCVGGWGGGVGVGGGGLAEMNIGVGAVGEQGTQGGGGGVRPAPRGGGVAGGWRYVRLSHQFLLIHYPITAASLTLPRSCRSCCCCCCRLALWRTVTSVPSTQSVSPSCPRIYSWQHASGGRRSHAGRRAAGASLPAAVALVAGRRC